ncbi:biopolymer transporter ExbD [bacterium SCSIO 12827]|nr:biopolymer transporter ExbD [bacterium SCSIO 12827]
MRSLRPGPGRGTNDDDRILPLINVVFLLLIFFMLAGHLAATDPFHIEPPVSASETEPDEAGPVILVGTDGRIAFDGKTVDDAGLKAALIAPVEAGVTHFRVKADGGAPAVRLVEIMELLRAAGVRKVNVLTVPKAL